MRRVEWSEKLTYSEKCGNAGKGREGEREKLGLSFSFLFRLFYRTKAEFSPDCLTDGFFSTVWGERSG